MFEDERNSTAALIAADPAFTSLEASGAPISGDGDAAARRLR